MQGNWQNPNSPQQQQQQQGGYAQAPMPQAQPYQPPAQGPAGPPDVGFFSALFDFSFKSFVTLKFLKVVYILLAVLVVLGSLFSMYGMVETGQYMLMPAIPIAAVLYLIGIRMGLETFVLFFRFLQRKAESS